MSHIQIMCKPRNDAERKLLIDAGIITPAQKHTWVFLEQLFHRSWISGTTKVYAYWNVHTHFSYRVRSLRLTVKQFIDLFNLHYLVPEADITHIVPFVESTARNRSVLKYDYHVGEHLSDRYR